MRFHSVLSRCALPVQAGPRDCMQGILLLPSVKQVYEYLLTGTMTCPNIPPGPGAVSSLKSAGGRAFLHPLHGDARVREP